MSDYESAVLSSIPDEGSQHTAHPSSQTGWSTNEYLGKPGEVNYGNFSATVALIPQVTD